MVINLQSTYLKTKQLNHFESKPESELPLCTTKDLWMSEPAYKYYADPAKTSGRSTKNFTSASEAAAYKSKQGKGIVIEVKGEAKACAYCAGFALCSQKDKLIAEGLLKP